MQRKKNNCIASPTFGCDRKGYLLSLIIYLIIDNILWRPVSVILLYIYDKLYNYVIIIYYANYIILTANFQK